MKTASIESNAGNAVIGVSVSGGLIATVNEYAVLISLSLTILGLLIGLLFHILALKDRRKDMLETDKLKSMQMQIDILQQERDRLAKEVRPQ